MQTRHLYFKTADLKNIPITSPPDSIPHNASDCCLIKPAGPPPQPPPRPDKIHQRQSCVVEMDGKLFTPPVSCGLLPGTFRAHLLETGQVAERVIRVEEMKDCTHVFLVNSVRKRQAVKINR